MVEVVTTTIMDLKTQHSEIKKSNGVTRSELENFGNFLKGIDNVFIGDTINCPLKHSFSDNIYVREISIPKGTVLVGKIHKHEHPNFLMSGKVRVVTEETSEVLEGPLSMISSPGTKRALIALTDLVWITIHHNPTNNNIFSRSSFIPLINIIYVFHLICHVHSYCNSHIPVFHVTMHQNGHNHIQ